MCLVSNESKLTLETRGFEFFESLVQLVLMGVFAAIVEMRSIFLLKISDDN